jgi:translation initiation factor IF-3
VPVPKKFDRRPPERDLTRVNDRIRVPEVRLIGDDGKQIGIIKTPEALKYAQERDLDLVEVAPESRPPVCRVLDYSKYKYEQVQKQKAARKHQQQINVREIKLRPKIADNDYETKKGHVERFLKHRDKVKITIMFRGREVTHPERGEMLLQRLAADLGELAIIEQRPTQDGRNMTMLLGPGKTEEELAAAATAADEAAAAADEAAATADAKADAAAEAADAAPEPAEAVPEPAETAPEPAEATPEPDAAAPEPAEATPEPDAAAAEPDDAPEAPANGATAEPEAAPAPDDAPAAA